MLAPTLSCTLRSALRPSAAAPSLLPALVSAPRLVAAAGPSPQTRRHASVLASLADVPAAYHKQIRRGRGPASGKGKTAGRGHKGQKQHGKVPVGMNGGQTPDIVVHGVHGFENHRAVQMSPLNLDRLQSWIDQGRIDPATPITFRELVRSRCLHGIKDGVKLLAGRNPGVFKTPVEIEVSKASTTAIAAVEAAGGKIVTRFFNRHGIRAIVSPHQFEEPQRLAGASSRQDVEYYRDPARRGYLSHLLAEGESPSLFFKTPHAAAKKAKKGKNKKEKSANRLF